MGDVKLFEARIMADAVSGEAGDLIRAANPATMTPEQRRDMITAIKAGDVMGLTFKALAFGSGENANGARLSPEQIDELAGTAAGVDLLTDHGWSVDGVVGEVTAGEARDEGAERVLVLSHEITHPDAMEAFVRRRLRRFSVGIDAAGWRSGPDGREVWAISPVRLVHNAFVSDPAYDKARVVENANTREATGMSTENKGADQAARVAELEGALAGALADNTRLKEELDKREGEVFEAAFARAAGEGRVLPSSKAQFENVRKAAGLNAAVALFAAYPEQAALPTKPIGTSGATDAPKVFDAQAAADLIVNTSGRTRKEKK